VTQPAWPATFFILLWRSTSSVAVHSPCTDQARAPTPRPACSYTLSGSAGLGLCPPPYPPAPSTSAGRLAVIYCFGAVVSLHVRAGGGPAPLLQPGHFRQVQETRACCAWRSPGDHHAPLADPGRRPPVPHSLSVCVWPSVTPWSCVAKLRECVRAESSPARIQPGGCATCLMPIRLVLA